MARKVILRSLSYHLEIFLAFALFFFSTTQHGVRGSVVLCVTELAFSKKYIFAVKIELGNLIGKFSHYFFFEFGL